MLIRSVCLTTVAACGIAHADIPQMGGPMSHLLVSIFNQQVFISFESPSLSTVEMFWGPDNFDGSASVLNETAHNSQFGWLANGFISLPPESGVFVRQTRGTEYLSVYSEFGYEPILGTEDSDAVWQWNGSMTHNWYATDIHGPHRVEYEVFVGDLSGNPLDGWIAGTVELNFVFGPDLSDRIHIVNPGDIHPLPAPGSILVLAGGYVMASRRRRNGSD